MGKLLPFALAAGVISASAFATPQACSSGTLADYVALGSTGCTVGPLLFSNFEYSVDARDTPAPAAESVLLKPATDPLIVGTPLGGPFPGVGFRFEVAQTLMPERVSPDKFVRPSLDMKIGYTVSSPRALDRTAAAAVMSADQLATAAVTHTVEDGCSLYLNFRPADICSFANATNLRATEQVYMATGAANGAGATVRNFDVRYSTPEPRTWLLLGTGVLAFVLRARLRPSRRRDD